MDENKQLGLFNNERTLPVATVEKSQWPDTNYKTLEEAKQAAFNCHKCTLAPTRNNVVFAQGRPDAPIMLIGEGPGQHEDESGIPFVGRAGQLLDKIFNAVNFTRKEHIYITNIVKCRPPQNRVPTPEEMECCWEYLAAQIRYVQPKIILLCGSTAVKGILKTKQGITKIRGNWYENVYGAKAMPIFHPSYLLRNPSNEEGKPKFLMWQDIQEIRREFDSLSS